MARRFDIDAPLLIAGHPVVATSDDVLQRWVKEQRRGWRNPDRARWRDVIAAQVLAIEHAPDRVLVRTPHGEGWLHVPGDMDAIAVDAWVLVDARGRTLVITERPWLDARHDAHLPPEHHAVVDEMFEHAGHTIIRATWTTPAGLRVKVVADGDAAATEPGDKLTELRLVAGRPHAQ